MLLEYGVKNFFCFYEGVNVSFKLPANCPDNISMGNDISNILCLKGKNGSGKTNLLKGLSFLGEFCTNSFSYKPDEKIILENFYNNNEDTEFYIEFRVDNITYIYELTLNKEHVVKETLFRKERRKSKIIERDGDRFSLLTSEFSQLKNIKLRKNASFISIANQYDFDELEALTIVYMFFNSIISNVIHIGLSEWSPSIDVVSEMYFDDPDMLEFAKNIIIACDTGISNIEILKKKDSNDEERFIPVFTHTVKGINKKILFQTESSGTKSLFIQLAKYKCILDIGGILCLDEFDINLHPHILPVLLSLFLDKKVNTNQSQIIFTTHNSEIIDFLGRYRTYIVEKTENESFAYRLDEISGDILRNDRPILPIYNSGKIGGVPKL